MRTNRAGQLAGEGRATADPVARNVLQHLDGGSSPHVESGSSSSNSTDAAGRLRTSPGVRPPLVDHRISRPPEIASAEAPSTSKSATPAERPAGNSAPDRRVPIRSAALIALGGSSPASGNRARDRSRSQRSLISTPRVTLTCVSILPCFSLLY